MQQKHIPLYLEKFQELISRIPRSRDPLELFFVEESGSAKISKWEIFHKTQNISLKIQAD